MSAFFCNSAPVATCAEIIRELVLYRHEGARRSLSGKTVTVPPKPGSGTAADGAIPLVGQLPWSGAGDRGDGREAAAGGVPGPPCAQARRTGPCGRPNADADAGSGGRSSARLSTSPCFWSPCLPQRWSRWRATGTGCALRTAWRWPGPRSAACRWTGCGLRRAGPAVLRPGRKRGPGTLTGSWPSPPISSGACHGRRIAPGPGVVS